MTTLPTQPVETNPNIPDLGTAVLTALAEVRCVAVAELEAERAAGNGDLELASPEAVAVLAMLEARLGQPLARVEDLEPEQLTSVASLAGLLHGRWPVAVPTTIGGDA